MTSYTIAGHRIIWEAFLPLQLKNTELSQPSSNSLS